MNCKCPELTELEGNEALDYAKQHLIEVFVNGETWKQNTNAQTPMFKWLLDYPYAEYHGGGSPRLRKMTSFLVREHMSFSHLRPSTG